MLTIIHGNDITTSRKYFLDQKDDKSLSFDAESLELSELDHSLQGAGLFGASKKIFIDGLFRKKSSKNYDSILEILNRSLGESDVYLWSGSELGVKILSAFPKHIIQNFKIPQNIFGFLDGLRPNNSLNVKKFHEALVTTDPEIIFAMLVRQFRLMIGLSTDSVKNIDEIKRLAPWQKSKFQNQMSLFGQDKLKQIYKKLYKIDKEQKTGKSNLNLVQSIDIFLLEI